MSVYLYIHQGSQCWLEQQHNSRHRFVSLLVPAAAAAAVCASFACMIAQQTGTNLDPRWLSLEAFGRLT